MESKKLFIKMDKEKYKAIQHKMANEVSIPHGEKFKIKKHHLIFTFDIQYENEIGFVAIDIQSYDGQQKGVFTYKYDVTEAYQPGYFAFREGPLLEKALEDIQMEHGFQPSLLVIDGHGTAHPRKLGVASWLGVRSSIPSIGVAKEPLLKFEYDDELGIDALSTVDVMLNGDRVGYVLRSQSNVKPIFVSAGHKISQEEALRIAIKLRGEFRVLEPIRRADRAARVAAKEKA